MFIRSFLFLTIATAAALAQGGKPTPIEIRTTRGQMKYDIEEFEVAPGARIRLVLKNEDDLPHNLVICKSGKDGIEQEVAKKALTLPDGFEKHWIPDHPSVLFATKMVDPEKSGVLEFTVPKEEGVYPYVCTFPGHSELMNGKMIVGAGGSAPSEGKNGLSELTFTLYKGGWSKLPDFSKLEPAGTDHVKGGLITLKAAGKLSENFALVFNGKLEAPKDGKYSFKLSSDDGSRLIIDGKTVIDHDSIHANSSKDGSVELKKGSHDIEVQYFEKSGQEELALSWSGPGFKNLALSDKAAQKKKNNRKAPSGMELVVKDEAVIYRNFIEGAGSRAIGVGYPGQKNIAYDADQCRLALVWQGAFIDAARHWNGRGQGFQPPLGYNVYKCVEGVPFARLESKDTPWPDTARKQSKQRPDNGYVFRGYKLQGEQRYPQFCFDFEGEFVTDSFSPLEGGDGKQPRLLREIIIRESKGEGDLYFRAAVGASIEKGDADIYNIDGGKALMWFPRYLSPIIRDSGGKKELLIPVRFLDGTGDATIIQNFLFTH